MKEIELKNINININNLDTHISTLKLIKDSVTNEKKNPPITAGGGESITQIETIGISLKEIENNIEILIDNTIKFLDKVKTEYEKNDKNASQNF